MVSVAILLSLIAFVTIGTDGKTFRTPCSSSYLFRCDNGDCLHKHNWCDGSRHCNDGSDEKYCNLRKEGTCSDIHFKCDNMCIPIQGFCDGYSSCPEQADEVNCPCEEVYETEENIQYEAYIDIYRTQQKCWKISVSDGQYLDLQISTTLKYRNCVYGNVSVYSVGNSGSHFPRNYTLPASTSNPENYDNYTELLCPSVHSTVTYHRSFIYYNDVFIRYRSNYYVSSSNSNKDFLNITFQKIDLMCRDPTAFQCSNYNCIAPEKQCDGKKDCANGRDEENCDYGALSAEYIRFSRIKASRWMRSQHNSDWAWKENTHRAIVALYLAGDTNFNGSSKDDDLMAKQLELEVFTYLLRERFEKASTSAELAFYINALLVICHDPRSFYGFDLITTLKEDLEIESSFAPFPYLVLCNAKESIPEEAISRLLQNLNISSQNHGFIFELQALTTMALSCISNNENLKEHLEQKITDALKSLKDLQMEDGSFGNEYTTALVLQALIANNQENAKDWNPKASLEFLYKQQETDGSFGDFLTTYLIMPVLNAKSLLSVRNVNCTDNLKRPRDGNVASDIKSRLGKKVIMKYSIIIGDEKDQIHPLLFRTPENITVLELMTLAAEIDPKYKFKIHEIKKKKYIYEISNIPNDPENNKFWFVYQVSSNETILFPDQSPDKIKTHEKNQIIIWYKTLDSLHQ